MVLAVVRSHYGDDRRFLKDREKIYRASNALATWLGLHSWWDIVALQNTRYREELARLLTTRA